MAALPHRLSGSSSTRLAFLNTQSNWSIFILEKFVHHVCFAVLAACGTTCLLQLLREAALARPVAAALVA